MHKRINLTQFTRTPEQIKAMANQLLKGNKEVVIPLIEAHIELAYKIAGKFIGRVVDKSQDKKDSIIAQSFYGLTQAVNDAVTTLRDENITPYIAKKIAGKVRHFLDSDHLIPIEQSAFKELVEKGRLFEFLPVTMPLNEDTDEEFVEFDETDIPEVHKDELNRIFIGNNLSAELVDQLNDIEWSNIDRRIMTHIIEGFTYEEIGGLIGKNERFVKYHLQLIQERVRQVYEDHGSVPNL